MSNSGFQEALAHLLVSEAARGELVNSPDQFAARFDLTAPELDQLAALDARGLRFTAEGIGRLRVRALKRIFATTFKHSADAQRLDETLASFVASDIPQAGDDEARRWLAEGQRFVAHLQGAGAVAPEIADLARLEWLRFDLLYSPEADRWARRAAAGEPNPESLSDEELLDELRLQLGRHVRLAHFACDVLASGKAARDGGAPAGAPTATHVVLMKRPRRASVAAYRIGETAFAVLGACDGSATLREIVIALEATPDDPLSSAAEYGRFGLAQRLLVVADPPDSRPRAPETRSTDASGRAQSQRSHVV